MEQSISTSNIFIDCPVCNERIQVTDFVQHSYTEHFQFFVVWASYNAPQFIYPYLNEAYNDADEDLSYEYLLNLCDTIGYHKVGITDIDHVAPIVITDRITDKNDNESTNKAENENSKDYSMCTICLDTLHDYVLKRRITKCGHEFCAGCIERWLSENKTCPVCIQYLDDDQIASTSRESSDDSLVRSFGLSTLESLD